MIEKKSRRWFVNTSIATLIAAGATLNGCAKGTWVKNVNNNYTTGAKPKRDLNGVKCQNNLQKTIELFKHQYSTLGVNLHPDWSDEFIPLGMAPLGLTRDLEIPGECGATKEFRYGIWVLRKTGIDELNLINTYQRDTRRKLSDNKARTINKQPAANRIAASGLTINQEDAKNAGGLDLWVFKPTTAKSITNGYPFATIHDLYNHTSNPRQKWGKQLPLLFGLRSHTGFATNPENGLITAIPLGGKGIYTPYLVTKNEYNLLSNPKLLGVKTNNGISKGGATKYPGLISWYETNGCGDKVLRTTPQLIGCGSSSLGNNFVAQGPMYETIYDSWENGGHCHGHENWIPYFNAFMETNKGKPFVKTCDDKDYGNIKTGLVKNVKYLVPGK